MKPKSRKQNITYRKRIIKFMDKDFCRRCSRYVMMFYVKGLLKHK